MAEKNTTKDTKVDDELSELLDSALEDFGKDQTKTIDVVSKNEEPQESDEWSEEFLKNAAKNFDKNFMNFLGMPEGDPNSITEDQLKQGLEQMAAAAQVFLNQDGGEPSTDFAESITQAVKELSEGTSGDQGPFGNLNEADPNTIPPFMQGMMQSLLSKDVLYPSLQDVLSRFPEWLDNNKDNLSKEDRERYENQQRLMSDVCKLLEKEQESDSKEVKDKRFEEVLGLMQKLQDYGQPPTELVGEVGPTPDMKNCNVM